MKIVCFLTVIVCYCSGFSQRLPGFEHVEFDRNSIYLVTRGTDSKAGYVAVDFNLIDHCSSHVGIGILNNERLIIYHVANDQMEYETALMVETPQRFVATQDVVYFSLWQYKSSLEEVKALRSILDSFTRRQIAFDFEFNEKNDEAMYCSEFCAKVLTQLNIVELQFPLAHTTLNSLYAAGLNRHLLSYWPVDFFQYTNRFKRIYEMYFN